jgi:hypothetical protein
MTPIIRQPVSVIDVTDHFGCTTARIRRPTKPLSRMRSQRCTYPSVPLAMRGSPRGPSSVPNEHVIRYEPNLTQKVYL